jgi:hypothetical protein
VNYSGVALQKPEGGKFEVVRPSAPDSPVRQTRVLFGFFCSFLLNHNLIFLLVCVEPLAPIEYIILSKLVSPIICVGHSTTKIIYRKRLNPISLSLIDVCFEKDRPYVVSSWKAGWNKSSEQERNDDVKTIGAASYGSLRTRCLYYHRGE